MYDETVGVHKADILVGEKLHFVLAAKDVSLEYIL